MHGPYVYEESVQPVNRLFKHTNKAHAVSGNLSGQPGA